MYWYKYVYYPTYNRLDGLLSGVAIAGIYQFYPTVWSKISSHGNLSFILSLLILIAANFICYHQQAFVASIYGFTVVSVGYGLLVIAAISPSSFLYKWSSKVTSFIATLSFAIYLTHKGVIHITHLLLKDYKIEGNAMLLICIVTCTLFAYLINITIEKPFIKLGRKLIMRSNAVS
jgi:peptidoglycan/LPS O-acetylase OafA/YrhL